MAIKNSGPSSANVPHNSAFQINMKAEETDDPNALACPRCGHKQPKKNKTSNCVSCKRFMPTADARQSWKAVQKLQYANMEQYLSKPEDEETQLSFKKSRGSFQYVRLFRTFAVIGVLSATMYFATPVALKMAFGPSGYNKMQKSASLTFSQTSNTLSKLLRPIPQPHPHKAKKDAKKGGHDKHG